MTLPHFYPPFLFTVSDYYFYDGRQGPLVPVPKP